MIDQLEDMGVEWIISRRIDDLSLLQTDHSLDVGALALTMKEHKLEGAGASMEINTTGSKTNNVDFVIASPAKNKWAQSWRYEAQTGKEAYAGLQKLKGANSGNFPPVNHDRLIFHLPTLDKVLTESSATPVMELSPYVFQHGPYLYPNTKLADVTEIGDLKTIALVTKGRYIDLKSHDDVGVMVQQVHKQDADKGFNNFARFVGYSSDSAEELTGLEDEYRYRIVCVVDENEAPSVAVLRCAERMMRADMDFLHIVRACKVKSPKAMSAAQQSLGVYSPSHKRQDCMKTLLAVEEDDSDTPLQRLEKFVKEKNITMVVLPELQNKPQDFTSLCLKKLKVPMMVVKTGHKVLLTQMIQPKEGDTTSVPELAPLKVGMHPDFHIKPALEFSISMIDTRRDYLHFLWSGKEDTAEGQELWVRQQRLMVRVEQLCIKWGIKPRSKIIKPAKVMTEMVEHARNDVWSLVVGYLPQAQEIPKAVIDQLSKLPCPMILFREDLGPSEAAKDGLRAAEDAFEAEEAAELAALEADAVKK
mmetsp:Transcript_46273/g.148161  ORF Transcript_46273/g.148161 Transcript_46273/m.148161 type:complete len:532 (-) Transcript_46273:2030-3625(-)